MTNLAIGPVFGVVNQYTVATSSTRPSSPTDGDFIYETDTGYFLIYDGTEWLPPANTAWGTYPAAGASSVGVHTNDTTQDIWTVSLTLRSDREYLITGHISGLAQDITGSGLQTRMQLVVAYGGTIAQTRFWWSDAYDANTAEGSAFSAIVAGNGTAQDITLQFADSLGRGYDLDVYTTYSHFTVTDVGPA